MPFKNPFIDDPFISPRLVARRSTAFRIKLARLSPVSGLREGRGEDNEDGADDNGGDVAG
jgi:hypothetical protein